MNFVLHYHLGARDLGSEVAGVGAMLPDLWRMADRRVRPARDPARVAGAGELGAVLDGIEHHLAIDKWFHADPVFTAGERLAADRLREAAIAAPRIGLFAHILWELCLDGELVARLGLDAVLRGLRAGFARVEESGGGARAAELHHFERASRSQEERELFDQRMRRLFTELARGPWIDGYQTGDGVAFRIEGVRARLGLAPMSGDDHVRLAEVASGLLEAAPPFVDRILARSA